MRRTQLYHTLLHYKIRLILKVPSLLLLLLTPPQVKAKLEKASFNSRVVTEDTSFVTAETRRFQTLITCAGQKYGGEEQAKVSVLSRSVSLSMSLTTPLSSPSGQMKRRMMMMTMSLM
jgi:hypothetical protein